MLSKNNAAAQTSSNCGCNHTITQSGIYRPKTSNTTNPFFLDVKPGQTICIAAGNYSQIRFFDFAGKPDSVITIRNACNGQVTIGNRLTSGGGALVILNGKYLKVTGSGTTADTYGIRIDSTGGGQPGMSIYGFSTDVEVERVEVKGASFSGIMVKNDPNCDSMTWRGNQVMRNMWLHDNYVHDGGGEGLYIGNSFWNDGRTLTCGGTARQVFPHEIFGLKVYNNRIERTSAEGIQVGCSPDALIYNNVIDDCGRDPFALYQNNGAQMGGGSGGCFYNNTIRNSNLGTGLMVVGLRGFCKIYNNKFINSKNAAIYVNNANGTVEGSTVDILNNTIINTNDDAIILSNEVNINTLVNNVVVKSGGNRVFSMREGGANYTRLAANTTAYNNVYYTQPLPTVFSDTNNYRLNVSSPLVNAGADLRSRGVDIDIEGNPRPLSYAFDIGAYEFEAVLPVELNDFRGVALSEGKNMLSWVAFTEENIANYDVERSNDGVHFEKIGTVKAKNASKVSYQFLDEYVEQTHYYRLHIIGTDGSENYSKIISIEKQAETAVKAYPSVVSDILTIEATDETLENVDIQIVNALGQVVFQEKVETLNPQEALKIETNTLAKGNFIWVVNTKNRRSTGKFVKM